MDPVDPNTIELALFVLMIVTGIVSDMLTLSQKNALRVISRFCLFMFFMCFGGIILTALTQALGVS